MMDLFRLTRFWIGMVAVCTFAGWLPGCAQPGGVPGGEGSSLPPSQSAATTYVFPPPDLQVYD